jgi:hypothetical protein
MRPGMAGDVRPGTILNRCPLLRAAAVLSQATQIRVRIHTFRLKGVIVGAVRGHQNGPDSESDFRALKSILRRLLPSIRDADLTAC